MYAPDFQEEWGDEFREGPEHAQVWPRVESLCERITWQGFDFLA